MNDTPENHWGPFGIVSVLIGVTSWFLGGMLSLVIGMVAVALGFIGNKKHQRLSQTGMMDFKCSRVLREKADRGILSKSQLIIFLARAFGFFDWVFNSIFLDFPQDLFKQIRFEFMTKISQINKNISQLFFNALNLIMIEIP